MRRSLEWKLCFLSRADKVQLRAGSAGRLPIRSGLGRRVAAAPRWRCLTAKKVELFVRAPVPAIDYRRKPATTVVVLEYEPPPLHFPPNALPAFAFVPSVRIHRLLVPPPVALDTPLFDVWVHGEHEPGD